MRLLGVIALMVLAGCTTPIVRDTSDVHYVPGFNWLSLKHELSHCQGYADHGIPIQIAAYTEQQRTIMDREKVTRWVDTSVYKTSQQ